MKKLIVAVLVALVTACGSDKKEERPIQYGAPSSPSLDEQGAAGTAQTTLQGSLVFQPSTEPSYGAPGLADQLVANLGGYSAAKTMPTAQSQKLAASTVSRAIDTGGIDPGCVVPAETSVTWTGCTDTVTTTDPVTGDTTTMTVTVDGTLTWNALTGVTAWDIHETAAMTATEGGNTLTMNVTADLDGSLTVTASTIAGNTTSGAIVRGNYAGIPLNQAVLTTLAVNLGYQAEPFCITSGTLVLEQRWTERPMGATEANLPNQGWRFEWTGCNQLMVAHGS